MAATPPANRNPSYTASAAYQAYAALDQRHPSMDRDLEEVDGVYWITPGEIFCRCHDDGMICLKDGKMKAHNMTRHIKQSHEREMGQQHIGQIKGAVGIQVESFYIQTVERMGAWDARLVAQNKYNHDREAMLRRKAAGEDVVVPPVRDFFKDPPLDLNLPVIPPFPDTVRNPRPQLAATPLTPSASSAVAPHQSTNAKPDIPIGDNGKPAIVLARKMYKEAGHKLHNSTKCEYCFLENKRKCPDIGGEYSPVDYPVLYFFKEWDPASNEA